MRNVKNGEASTERTPSKGMATATGSISFAVVLLKHYVFYLSPVPFASTARKQRQSNHMRSDFFFRDLHSAIAVRGEGGVR